MRKLMWVAGGGVAGFVLAVLVLRFVLASGGDTTIKLVSSAPPIPAVAAGSPATSSAAVLVDSTPDASAAPAATAPASPVESAAGTVDPPAARPAAAATNGPFHFKADPGQSSAKILVTQAGVLGNSLLVANGSNVTGDVYLTPDGRLGESPSAFQIDMRTLRSSDSELSSFLKNQLEAASYPYGRFEIASATGIPATYTDGAEFTFTMTGALTMHGRTKSITWTGRARQSGEFLTFAADADFLMTDYGWTPPDYGVAWAKNSVHIQVTVIARKDASGEGDQVRIATPATSSASGASGPASVAPSDSSQAPVLSSSAPVLSSPSTSTPGLTSAVPNGLTSASSLTSLLGGLGTLLTGNGSGGGLPSFSLEDLMKMLGGLGGNGSLFSSGR